MTNKGPLAIAHNGNLVNAAELRDELEAEGSIFTTTSDTEVFLHLMARSKAPDVVHALEDALQQVRGAYSLVILSREKVIAGPQDLPHSARRLVVIASKPARSTSSTPSPCGRRPGEMSCWTRAAREPRHGRRTAFCVFEHVYFARPDSAVFGRVVADSRRQFGRRLAREFPVAADVVVPVPDSGVFAALGYAEESGITYGMGLVRNHYVGRTFIEPRQAIRHFGVKVKLNAVRSVVGGKRVVLIDDSIVRGTTSKKIVGMIRAAGASEVHMRISSPPTEHPCHYGIDTPRRGSSSPPRDLEGIGSSSRPAQVPSRSVLRPRTRSTKPVRPATQALVGDPASRCLDCRGCRSERPTMR
jgi:amidophosphoribosyltransferase